VGQTYEYDVVIIGAGPAGLTAGMYAGRAMLSAVMLERLGEPGGEILNTELVEDYPGFESILGRELAEKFASHAAKFGAELRTFVIVERVEKGEDGYFTTTTDDGDVYRSPTVILTAGGTPIKLGVPGEELYAGKGVSYCAICDGAFFREHTIAVVGGGDAALEEEDFLTRYAKKVYLLHRREEFRASKLVQKRVFENPKIEILRSHVVEEVMDPALGKVTGLRVKSLHSGREKQIECAAMFVAIGHTPMVELFKGQLETHANGYLRVKPGSTQTSVEGVFAAGDVADWTYRQAVTAAGTGCMAALDAERWLTATGH